MSRLRLWLSAGAALELFAALVVNNLMLAWIPDSTDFWSGALKTLAAALSAVVVVFVLEGAVFALPQVSAVWLDSGKAVIDGPVLAVPRRISRPTLQLRARRGSLLSTLILRGFDHVPLALRVEPQGRYRITVDASTPDGQMDDQDESILRIQMPISMDGARLDATLLIERCGPAGGAAADLHWSVDGAPLRVRSLLRVRSSVRMVR